MKKSKTRFIVRIILAVGTLVSMFFVPWILVWAWILPLPDTVQEQVNEAVIHGFDGIIVYVDEPEQASSVYTAGWHDRENKIPAKPQALFKLASIDKLYVAAAIVKLVNSQRLVLDKTLADYFPELVGRVEHAETISLRMLVQHRSGIPNYTDFVGYWEQPRNNDKEKLELVLDWPANFEPDKDYEYSNTNYLLLSMLIEKVVGYSHHQFIKESIITPLGLKNTYASLSEVNIDEVMGGYYVGVEPDIKTNNYGSMLATVEDVGIFLRALGKGTLFNHGGQEIYSSLYEYEHGGLIPGYQSYAEYYPDIDTVVVQVINTTDFNGYDWNLSTILFGRIEKILRKNSTSE